MDTLTRLRNGELTGTERLSLRGGLTEFPKEIFDLADTLEILDLSENRLSELPEDLGRLKKLWILFCSGNEFTRFPAVIGDLPELEMIGFKANRIETVDAAAFSSKLRWLILTDNRIATLPGAIGRCGRLQKLMLSGNRLERLPEEMAACVNLELVRLAANRFEEFPKWLFELPRLSWLGLGGNPWSERQMVEVSGMEEIDWGHLEISHVLGEGASGVIHHARWNGGPVAVKIFKGAVTSDGLPASEMAACLAAGAHENLIPIMGRIAGHSEGRNGLVMSLIDRDFTSLAGPPDFSSCTRDVYQESERLHLAVVLRMAWGLARAAAQLHARRIMHGDFYAHNVLRNRHGHPLLGDFGAAFIYPEGAGLEPLEARAFGILLEELLERCDADENEAHIVEDLWRLQKRCAAEAVTTRPGFAEISSEMKRLVESAMKTD